MPAEWEPHAATWLSWPHNEITWPGRKLAEVENIYVQMMSALLPNEKVNLLVSNTTEAKKAATALSRRGISLKNLIFHRVNTVDTWIRDYGPIFVKKAEVAFTKWIFNAWGGKYQDLARDTGVVDKLPVLKKYKRVDTGIILEGGSIDVNGRGTLLTTEQCLLNPGRNKHLSKSGIENYLKKYLGVRKVVWLKEGIEGDDTDGHVDDITRFINVSTILTALEPNTRDKNHAWLQENLEILKREKDADGKRFTLVELPMPGVVGPARSDMKHKRLPASYANFYIANGVVLLPVYSHANDKKTERILKKCFPSRKIVPIECSPLVYGLGSIHCVTQQEPR